MLNYEDIIEQSDLLNTVWSGSPIQCKEIQSIAKAIVNELNDELANINNRLSVIESLLAL